MAMEIWMALKGKRETSTLASQPRRTFWGAVVALRLMAMEILMALKG